jgi:kynurenine 3-monooxygenase
MKCYPWTYDDKVALMVMLLMQLLPLWSRDEWVLKILLFYKTVLIHGDNWRAIFLEYEQLRKPNADAIAELAERNFMEMSSKLPMRIFFIAKRKLKNGSQTNIQINGRRFIVWSLLVLLHT